MKRYFLLVLLLLLSGCAPQADVWQHPLSDFDLDDDEVYRIVADESLMTWRSTNFANETHSGSIPASRGVVRYDGEQITSATVLFDMEAFNIIEGPYITYVYMTDYDFFDTRYYPDAQLFIRSIESLENGSFRVRALLEFVEVEREVRFDAKLYAVDDRFAMRGSFPADIYQWGIIQKEAVMWDELGVERLNDEFVFDMEFVFES